MKIKKAKKRNLSFTEVSEQYGNSVTFWRREVWAGRLAHVKLGRRVLVPRKAILGYLADHTVPTKAALRDHA